MDQFVAEFHLQSQTEISGNMQCSPVTSGGEINILHLLL
jgi:hypothetical protein